MSFCSQCGTELSSDMRFCPNCGQQNTGGASVDKHGRSICPNCGNQMDPMDAVCDYCGFQVVKRAATSSVQKLSDQLIVIENERLHGKKKGALSSLLDMDRRYNVSDTAAREITLIKSFPVPNTVEELTEFMILAEGNINVSLSKKSVANKLRRSTAWQQPDDAQHISDAWIAKMHQIYRKSKLAFGDTSQFAEIQEIYYRIMKDLKLEIDE